MNIFIFFVCVKGRELVASTRFFVLLFKVQANSITCVFQLSKLKRKAC